MVIRLEQNLVAEYCEALRERLLDATQDKDELTLDLSDVTMIDSSGLGVLIATQNTLAKQDKQLVLKGVADNIRRMMTLMRLDRHFHIED